MYLEQFYAVHELLIDSTMEIESRLDQMKKQNKTKQNKN